MRLIDADKLPATCTVIVVDGHRELTGWIAAERIDEAPTVEAIPIEWIISKSQDYLVDRYITGTEMKFIKFLIDEWRLSK